MCTVLLPPDGNPIAVKYIVSHHNGLASGLSRGRVYECCDCPIEQSQRDTKWGQNKEFK